MMLSHPFRTRTRAARTGQYAVSLGLAAFALFAAGEAFAQQTLRVQVDQHGDMLLIGNTLGFDCAAGIPAPVVGTANCQGSNNNNDSAPDIFWRSEQPGAGQAAANTGITVGQARSTALLTVPNGASVTHAFLYWGASRGAGADPTVTFDRPGGFTQDVTALAPDRYANGGVYECVTDVTGLVQTNGSGAYRVSGVDANTFVNNNQNVQFAGWTLVVFYSDPSQPPRNLALFDGLSVVDGTNSATATLSGFLVPNAGFDAKLGIIAYEGDNGINGDQLRFGTAPLGAGDALSDGVNTVNNFFNSSRSLLGNPVSNAGDLPQLTGGGSSMGSFDIDVVDITGRVTGGQTSADIEATTTGDVYYLGAFVTSISSYKPDYSTSVKAVTDVNGGALRPGDQLRYTITATNTGNDTAIGVVMTDVLPPEVTYVAGSLTILSGANAGAKTDAANDDQGNFTNGTVTVRLGSGADAVNGGTMLVNESTVIEFLVTVNNNVVGPVANQAVIGFSGEQGSPPETTPTDGNNGNPGQDPTVVDVEACLIDADCTDPQKPICDTVADPNLCVQCLSNNDCNAPTPVCEPTSQTCVQCLVTSDCPFDNQTCDPGTFTCTCTPAGAEVCGNNIDEDCDGQLDNGCLDSDGDGLPDTVEIQHGTNPNDADTDDDGVIDGQEPSWDVDSDGDGLINALDPDSDNDGLFDGTEMGLPCTNPATDNTQGHCHPDADGGATTTNPLDADTDHGGVPDGSEDTDLDGVIDPGERDPNDPADDQPPVDTDGDGIPDVVETQVGTNPQDADSDDDGVIDGQEPNWNQDTDNDGLINALDPDSDNDGLFDGTEMGKDCSNPDTDNSKNHCRPDADNTTTTSPLIPDSDGAGAIDGSEDCNLNGRVDAGETDPNLPGDDATIVDTDGDGLSDCIELTIGTDPNDQDTDNDGVIDGQEPNPSDDTDGDGLINALDPDSDNDGLFDGTEMGKDCSNPDTDASVGNCIPDADGGATTTDPLDADTDNGGVSDGDEDTNHNGRIDPGERDPNNGADDLGGAGGNGAGGGQQAKGNNILQGGGCGCSLPGNTSEGGALLALALGAVAAGMRRRSRKVARRG